MNRGSFSRSRFALSLFLSFSLSLFLSFSLSLSLSLSSLSLLNPPNPRPHQPSTWANQGGSFTYTVSVNTTARCNEDKVTGCVKSREQYLLPLKLALDSAFARIYGGPTQTRFKADVAIMPHPTEASSDQTKVAFQLRYGALFFCESLG